MRQCLSKKVRESETALKNSEDKALWKLNHWDEDEKYVSLAKKNIRNYSVFCI